MVKSTKKTTLKKWIFILLAIIPTFFVYILFNIVPSIEIFRASFFKWDIYNPDLTKFVGFNNYKIMFHNEKFLTSLGNTAFLVFTSTAIVMFLALVSSYALTKTKIKGTTFFKVVLYIPNILSIVVISTIFMNVFEMKGLFNGILNGLHITDKQVQWMSGRWTSMGCFLFIMVWQATGYYMVMYMAGMDNISPSLYECADLEGASGAVKFFKITLPLTWSIIKVTLSIIVISSVNLSFLLVNSMLKASPGESDVLLNTMYYEANQGSYGYGMAIGSFLYVVTFGLAFIIEKTTKHIGSDI